MAFNVAVPASAAGTKKVAGDVTGDGKVTYASFGESVANGFGMDGYSFDDVDGNVYGFKMEVEQAYPHQAHLG